MYTCTRVLKIGRSTRLYSAPRQPIWRGGSVAAALRVTYYQMPSRAMRGQTTMLTPASRQEVSRLLEYKCFYFGSSRDPRGLSCAAASEDPTLKLERMGRREAAEPVPVRFDG